LVNIFQRHLKLSIMQQVHSTALALLASISQLTILSKECKRIQENDLIPALVAHFPARDNALLYFSNKVK
jgi:hypothetical protein